jgi:drug/metabolite transporter (DMT)-like permease
MRAETKAHLALLGANLFYGISYTAAKAVMPSLIQPSAFILIRVSLAALLFWSSIIWTKRTGSTIRKKDIPMLVLGGLFGVAMNQLLFFEGLSRTLPIHASILMMCTPLFIWGLSCFLGKENLNLIKIIGLSLGVSGAILLMSSNQTLAITGATWLGDLLVLLNAISYAIYLILIKPLMSRYRPVVVIRWVFLFGWLFVLPFGWNDFQTIDWSLFTAVDYTIVVFIVVCVTFLSYLWNVYALRHVSPSTAGVYIYLQPVFAAVVSMSIAGEKMTIQKLLAALLVFTGVYLANFYKSRIKGTQ